jgi:hypothetical protein
VSTSPQTVDGEHAPIFLAFPTGPRFNPPAMDISTLADIVVVSWAVNGVAFFLFSWVNPVILTAFLVSRILRIRDPQFDLRPNTPTHTALHHFCAVIYGLALPTFYFLSVRTRHELGPWYLGGTTNTTWTVALGVLCMIWLAAHLIESAIRLGPPRYGPALLDRLVAAVALFLCLWFHVKTTEAGILRPAQDFGAQNSLFNLLVISLLYPQFCFLGASLVYGLALLDSLRAAAAKVQIPEQRRWRVAVPIAAAVLLTLFAPLWLSIPRVTHRQAVTLLEQNRELIRETAHQADLDPRLLAGVIYVAQTRDHHRFAGDALEEFGIAIWEADLTDGIGQQFNTPLINASAGLCQIRPTTAVQTLHLLGTVSRPAMPGTLHYAWTRVIREFTRGGTTPYQTKWRSAAQARERCGSMPKDLWRRALEGRLEPILLEPENSLALAALMLAILDEQWRVAGHPIHDRPEILATLYNLGYERSEPKPDPQPNDFGRRVAAFMQTDQCRRLFPLLSPSPSRPARLGRGEGDTGGEGVSPAAEGNTEAEGNSAAGDTAGTEG